MPSGVAEPKGQIGYILSKMFNESGKISNAVVKALGTRSDGRILRWSGGLGGQFVNGTIYDTGTQVGIGATPDAATLKLDVVGSIGATEYCDGSGNNCFDPSVVALSGSTVGGSGNTGYLARFTGPMAL